MKKSIMTVLVLASLTSIAAHAKSFTPSQEEICANQATRALVAINAVNGGETTDLQNTEVKKDLVTKTFSVTAVNFKRNLIYKASSFLAGNVCTVTEVIVSDLD